MLLVFDSTALEDRHVIGKMTQSRNRIACRESRMKGVDHRPHLILRGLLARCAGSTD
jgi:hypothetical protein